MAAAELSAEQQMDRLRWQCRRGLLELDLIFEHFLEERYLGLPPEEQQLFVQLLGEPDPELQSWLISAEPVAKPVYAELVRMIRGL